MNQYNYLIDSFLNNKVNASLLTQEIISSSITIALDSISVEDYNCIISFKASLLEEEIIILNQIVANHTGEILPDENIINKDENGNLIVVPTLSNFGGKNYYEKGYRLECLPSQLSYIDIEFDTEVLLFGGKYKIVGNYNENDYLEIKIGIKIETQKIEVASFCDSRYIKFFPEGEIKRSDSGKILSLDYFIRVKYINMGENKVDLGFIIEAWK